VPTPTSTPASPSASSSTAQPGAAGSFSLFESGAPASWDRGSFFHPRLGREFRGKLFLREHLALSGMEVSLNRVEPGRGVPFRHRHQRHEELYLFLSGTGEFQVDDEVFAVGPGSAVRVGTSGARAWRNTGSEPLVFVVVQAAEGSLAVGSVDDGERVPGDVRW
jgi:mannose-6-phosphate isomerase-like protein (cupin superfamily)